MKTKFPTTSMYRFLYSEINAGYNDDIDQFFVDIFTIKITNMFKKYMFVEAEFGPVDFEVTEENIHIGEGTDFNRCNVTMLERDEIKSERHKKWLRSLLQNYFEKGQSLKSSAK